MVRAGKDGAAPGESVAMTSPEPVEGMAGDQRLRGLVGYSLKRAYYRFQSDAARVLEGFGLRISTYSALVVICDNTDLRQSQLAQILSVERSNTVVVVDALEQAGLIARHRVPKDRRSYALRPTRAGRQLCDRASAALDQHEDRILTDIDPAERAELLRLLQRMEAAAVSREDP
ncbi:MarR family winged helix-turn-helix transcriptional regulator [Pseudooceanicola algae]|uniref:Transcriptional regulator SlyA n=1 Tax=Pseudooceanicola algae TaxID=1537215 RepID=A0A418SKW1_9RHOB|nr:MarR family transcriptional regulator [Pseudooceanicola algae]QPM91020.1 Transcriptional regulator SlyA [Pseudooceanicola algae]